MRALVPYVRARIAGAWAKSNGSRYQDEWKRNTSGCSADFYSLHFLPPIKSFTKELRKLIELRNALYFYST